MDGAASRVGRAAQCVLLAVALVAYAALAFGYVTLTPIWQNPDEPAHYNYVAFVAETGGLPVLRAGDWDSALLERLKNGRLQPGDDIGAIRYESWQPPLYYLAAAPMFRLGPPDEPHVQVARLRAFDALLGGLTVLVGYLIAREVLPPWLAIGVPLVLVGVPMFTAVSSAVSADPLANLLAAGLLLVLVRRWRADSRAAACADRGSALASAPGALFAQPARSAADHAAPSVADHAAGLAAAGDGLATNDAATSVADHALRLAAAGDGSATDHAAHSVVDHPATSHGGRGDNAAWAIGAGVLLGMGLLTKLALGIFVPLLLLTLLVRAARPVRDSALLLCAAGLTVLPWLAHQVTSYGWADPLATSRHAAVVLDQPRFPGLSLPFVSAFVTTTFHSFWAQFGWMGVVAPDRLYWVWGLACILALGGLLLEHAVLLHEPLWRLLVATVAVAGLAFLGYNLTFQQAQGRYLFTALVPIAMLLVLGWARWLPRPVQGWGLVLLGLALIGLNAYSLLRVLVPGFAPTG